MFENFCPLIVTMQMLVAAFNPSATSGTQVGALLFSDSVKGTGPSPVFSIGTLCFDAVQGQGNSLLSLMLDFGDCFDNHHNYNSTMLPSLCGESLITAIPGLREIYNIASTTRSSTAAVLMLTDGIIQDNATERTRVLSDLRSAGINTLIAAGIGDANIENLILYTSNDNILIQNDPVDLGIDIVNQMAVKGILCQEHGI